MQKIRNLIRNFFHNENGSELMQWAIIIVIVAGLAVIAVAMSGTLTGKLEEAQSALDAL